MPTSPVEADSIDAFRNDLQRVDVETRVGLVEDSDARLQQLELQDLVPLLLAAGEALVDVPLRECRVDREGVHRAAHLLDPRTQLRRLAADRGRGGPEEVGDGDAGHLDGVLHREEQAGASAGVDRHGEDVLAVEGDRALGDDVLGVTRDGVRQGGLTGAVRAHDRVRLTGLDGQVDAAQDLPRGRSAVAGNADVQIADLEGCHAGDVLLTRHRRRRRARRHRRS